MNRRIFAYALIVSLALPTWALAHGDENHAKGEDLSADPEAGSAEAGKAGTAGLVKKVDKAAGKVTIRHGPIENLGMPKMTMIFRVADPSMLDRLKEGDRIRFVADKVNGAFTIMQVEPAE